MSAGAGASRLLKNSGLALSPQILSGGGNTLTTDRRVNRQREQARWVDTPPLQKRQPLSIEIGHRFIRTQFLVVLANKLARIAWSVLRYGPSFDASFREVGAI